MAKLTLADLANLNNPTTAVTSVNANNALIEAAVEKTLSRDGTSPNVMNADLDMNGYNILNVVNIDETASPLGYTVQNAITAAADGTRASATALTGNICRITTVAGAADSVIVRAAATAGDFAVIINDGANEAAVFWFATDKVDASVMGTGSLTILAGRRILLFCPVAGVWCSLAHSTSWNFA